MSLRRAGARRYPILLLACLALCACTTVAPYQRGYLARPDMALSGDPGTTRALDKTFDAKEAARGGASVGGGGCGCN
jgi:uncharacterized protein DUF4266